MSETTENTTTTACSPEKEKMRNPLKQAKLYTQSFFAYLKKKPSSNGEESTTPTWGPFTAIASCLRRYAQFNGRASRTEFWYTALGNFIILTILQLLLAIGILMSILGDYNVTTCVILTSVVGLIYLFYQGLMLVPGLAVTVRRMHDIGKSGAAICFYFIPVAGPIILLVFLLTASAPANQYGEAPEALPETKKGNAFINGILAVPSYLHQTWKFGIFSWACLIFGCWFILSLFTPSYFYDKYTKENNSFVKANKKYRRGNITINKFNFFECWVDEVTQHMKEKEINALVLCELAKNNADKFAEQEEMQDMVESCKDYLDAANDMAETLVDKGADPTNIAELSFRNGLMNADMMEILLDAGMDANLHLNTAIKYESANVLALLLEAGAKTNETHLFLAVSSGCIETTELILKNGVDINSPYNDDNRQMTITMLYEAVAQQHEQMVKYLLDQGATPDIDSLNLAISNNKTDIALLLLEKGAKADNSSLHVAICQQNLKVVEQLLKQGVEANKAYEQFGHTHYPLISAVNENNNDIVKVLLQYGADVNSGNPLHIALAKNNEQAIDLLLAAGADTNGSRKANETILYTAIKEGNLGHVQKLVAAGVDVNKRNPLNQEKYADTPLLAAIRRDVKNGTTQYIDALLKQKQLDVNITDTAGVAPVAVALDSPQIIELLISHGANVDFCCANYRGEYNKTSNFESPKYSLLFKAKHNSALSILKGNLDLSRKFNDGETYLSYAISTSNFVATQQAIEIIQAFIDKKAVINMEVILSAINTGAPIHVITLLCDNCTNFNANDALSAIIKRANYNKPDELIQYILDKGEEFKQVDEKGNPILIQCLRQNTNQDIYKMLMQHPGIDINQQDADGNTALHILAAEYNQDLLISMLSMKNIDTTVKNNNGKTAYQVSTRSNQPLFKQQYEAELKSKAEIEKARQQAEAKQRELERLAAAEEQQFENLLSAVHKECSAAYTAIPYGRSEAAQKEQILIKKADAICNGINKVCNFKVKYADVETLQNRKAEYAEAMESQIMSVINEGNLRVSSNWLKSSTIKLYQGKVMQSIKKMSTCKLNTK